MNTPPKRPVAPSVSGGPRIVAAFAILLAMVLLTYSNHFGNTFHFDDDHTVVQNPYIRDLHNTPLFFTDARTISVLPANQVYRPLLTFSLAVDYWLGHGLKPVWFHIPTFLAFLLQLGLMLPLFRYLFDAARPDGRNGWTALFATALYGLHPVMAETVNYVMQRADLYSTLGVVAGLLIYVAAPALRRYGLYLLPVISGLLFKAPAAVFPALLFAYVWLFEEENFRKAVIRCLPAFIVTGAAAYFVLKMNAPTFTAGGSMPFEYRISQPAVLLTYFRKFFVPTGLSADTDRVLYSSLFQEEALFGVLFLAMVCAAIFWCRQRREMRPIAFGLFWFLVSCVPTSWIVLAEVENDHRMFFPFVGLALSVCWAAALWLYRHPLRRIAGLAMGGLLLASCAWGAYERNKVWHTEESLWLDVTRKSPANGRGLMNYALTQMEQGKYQTALDYFNRALVYTPNYHVLEINLGVVNGAMGNKAEAERHFARALALAPAEVTSHYYYARWLNEVGRPTEAITHLREAVAYNPAYLDARYLLMQIYAGFGDSASLREEATDTLAKFPSDTVARSWLARGVATPTAESYLTRSLVLYQAGKYAESEQAARKALTLRPNYGAALNNIMAADNMMGRWQDAIRAGEEAVRLEPGNVLARNNLAYAKSKVK